MNEFTTAWAARGGHLDCLQYLVDIGCPWDRGVGELASLNGHLDVLQWYLRVQDKDFPRKICFSTTPRLAARGGHLHVLRWITRAENVHGKLMLQLRSDVVENAAAGGHLHILEWTRRQPGEWKWRSATAYAAAGGHLKRRCVGAWSTAVRFTQVRVQPPPNTGTSNASNTRVPRVARGNMSTFPPTLSEIGFLSVAYVR